MPNVARLIDMFCMHCRFGKSLEPFRRESRESIAGRLITLIVAISLLSVCPLTPAGAIPTGHGGIR